MSVYDLEGDGSPEILVYRYVFDAQGNLLATLDVAAQVPYNALVVADLNQDGAPEIISGRRAWTWQNGAATLYYDANIGPGHVQIGDLVGDARPEVLVTGPDGFSVLDAQGQVLLKDQRPVTSASSALAWQRPATIHDFDGDGESEFAFSVADSYLLVELEDNGPGVAPTVTLAGQWDILDFGAAITELLRPGQDSKPLRLRSGVRRSELSLEMMVPGGRWAGVVTQGGRSLSAS